MMRPGGRALLSYFLINTEADRFICTDVIKMPHTWQGDAGCRVNTTKMPDQATAHDEQRIRHFHAEADLRVYEMTFGNWCGRPSLLGLQDLVLALKSA